MVYVKIDDYDIKILEKVKENSKRVFKFPLGKTLRVDLDEGTVEGLEEYKPSKSLLKKIFDKDSTKLNKIYIHGQIVDDYPATYITLHKSLPELEKSIIKVTDEDISEEYTEVRDKKNKIIQNGGSSCNKRGGYMYRKKGGMNILKMTKMLNNLDKIQEAMELQKKLKNPKKLSLEDLNKMAELGYNAKKLVEGQQMGGSKIIKNVEKKIKEIVKLSSKKVNTGLEKINKLAKETYINYKGGNMKNFNSSFKKLDKELNKMKKIYNGGKYCGGSNCSGNKCKYCKNGGSNCGGSNCRYCKK